MLSEKLLSIGLYIYSSLLIVIVTRSMLFCWVLNLKAVNQNSVLTREGG